ncbi:MAG: HAMP domain-containing histidine kinase [Bacteroidetes bacterium]|nr:HAMP domain-containing histidine kinase [Bacteroidota bacterium]
MKSMFPKTIKSKFIFISITFIIFAVGLPMHFLVKQFRENFHQRSQLMLEATLDMLDNGMDNVMMLGKQKNVQIIVERIAENNNVNHIRIYNKDGKIKYSSEISEIGKNIFKVAPKHVPLDFAARTKRSVRILEDFHAYAAFEPIINKPECQSCHKQEGPLAFLDVDTHLTKAEISFYTGTLHLIFLGVAVIIVLTLGLLFLFNVYVNKPIQTFIGALDSAKEGNLTTRLKVERDDEFGKLNLHFNNMVSEIESSREKINELHNEQLRHVDKLATVGELTAQMAHEINNYTGIILTRSDYLLLESENNGELLKFSEEIKVIQKEIEKISNITKNVLRHSKKRKMNFINVNLKEVIDQSIKIFEPVFRKNGIEIIKEYIDDEIYVYGDASLLEQVFANLFGNAIDAIKTEGTIKISITAENEIIIVSVSDNGQGIDDATRPDIFSPFYTTKEQDKGTGLGLYIVKNICDQHNISIECESQLQKGTTFIVKLNGKRKQHV